MQITIQEALILACLMFASWYVGRWSVKSRYNKREVQIRKDADTYIKDQVKLIDEYLPGNSLWIMIESKPICGVITKYVVEHDITGISKKSIMLTATDGEVWYHMLDEKSNAKTKGDLLKNNI